MFGTAWRIGLVSWLAEGPLVSAGMSPRRHPAVLGVAVWQRPRCPPVEIEIEDVAYDDEGLLVVDFHAQSDFTVRGFDGTPAEREADLRNRNLWEVSEDRMTSRGGEELKVRRRIDGQPLTDAVDPWGFGAWVQYRDSQGA